MGSPRSQVSLLELALIVPVISGFIPTCCLAQIQAGVFDFGLGRQGEKRGSWTPGEWLACVLIVMIICLGLAVSIGLCYYVTKRQTRRAFGVENRLQQNGREVRQRNRLGEFVLVPGGVRSVDGQKQLSQNSDSLIAYI